METDPRFYNRLVEVSNNVGLSPEDLLVVMALESGINSSVHNANYGGLTQMSNNTLKGLGYTGDVKQFSQEPAFKQLDYIENHILKLANKIGGKFDSVEQYYIGNLLPVALLLDGVKQQIPDTIIVAQNPKTPSLPKVSIDKEKVYYNSNKGLDLDKDGAITYKDITNFLNKKRGESHYKGAIAQLGTTNTSAPEKKTLENKDLFNQLDSFLQTALASDIKNKINNYTIFVVADDLDSSVEFARILSLGLRNELNSKATTHINNNKVEVSCSIKGPEQLSKKMVQAFSDHLSKCFYEHTKNIGGLKVNAKIISNKKSSYEFIDYKTASLHYRQFLTSLLEYKMDLNELKEKINNFNQSKPFSLFISEAYKDQFIEVYTGDDYDVMHIEQQSQSNPAVFCGKVVGGVANFIVLDCLADVKNQISLGNIVFINIDSITALKPFNSNKPITNTFIKSGSIVQEKIAKVIK